ncbi:DUF1800 domain-containing protein [Pedobacter arcticus]|uniref:DUF1800 domain-containing protein n=1 Tax=Pedobacter arcticus TaxID=752140 RepID=UPI0006846D4F|nr:DUF1800 domain-containing protein [Pedobacter arcticus]
MKTLLRFFYLPFLLLTGVLLLSSFFGNKTSNLANAYKKAGLTDRQAALHLLNRFTFGPKPNDIEELLKIGTDKWFSQQLLAKFSDADLNSRLANYDAINLSNEEVNKIFPKNPQVLRMAIKDGFIDKDSVQTGDKKEYRNKLNAYMDSKGFRPTQELTRQFINQKILRAAYSENQLQEVLTDFWFNHFNVSLSKNDCAMYIPAYERDVIRPNVFGKFSNLLIATAKSPAMLFYLDNFSSVASNENEMAAMQKDAQNPKVKAALAKAQQNKNKRGLNENYAREVMELHTLGVDGGYTQSDVTQAARVLTGWTIYPMGTYGGGAAMLKQLDKLDASTLEKRGYVHDGDFLFVPNRHDKGDKVVLGKKFADGGYQEGVDLLNMLAHHPSTAKFICTKLAVRFVNDNPAQSIIDKMTKTFLAKDGDISAVLTTMVNAPEFWAKNSLDEKTKSPFELAISAVRALDANITQPYPLYTWINKMGQKVYYYQAPTGFPDKGQYWINTGALLNRMNFGLALAGQKISGVKINLAKLNNNHEPESTDAALRTYGKIILPERDLAHTIDRLTPFLNDPNLVQKVNQAASKNKPTSAMEQTDDEMMSGDSMVKTKPSAPLNKPTFANNEMLAQVVGVIIGAPEFQKR